MAWILIKQQQQLPINSDGYLLLFFLYIKAAELIHFTLVSLCSLNGNPPFFFVGFRVVKFAGCRLIAHRSSYSFEMNFLERKMVLM